jgi:hypothetical protein
MINKNLRNLQLKQNSYFYRQSMQYTWLLACITAIKATGESLSFQQRTTSTFKQYILYFLLVFLSLGPDLHSHSYTAFLF